jgi:DNA-binding NarL/FixJ family response regulator
VVQQLLLVEHNLYFRQGLALLLEWKTDLSSVHAESLAEAKSVLEDANQMPVCVIVDLDRQDGDGTELLKLLNGVPVLALSRSRNLELQAKAIGLGAGGVVSTTGPVEEIVSVVDRLIG